MDVVACNRIFFLFFGACCDYLPLLSWLPLWILWQPQDMLLIISVQHSVYDAL